MSVDCFVDSNVLVYAAVGRFTEPAKYSEARSVVAENDFGISGQVLSEFFVTTMRKADRPLSADEALGWIEDMRDRPCAVTDYDLVTRAIRIAGRYKISYWDGAIIAAAERLAAPILYTEDLNHGQFYGTVRAVNPFR